MKLDDDLCPHYLNLNFSVNFLCENELETHVQLPYPIHRPMKHSKIDIIKEFTDKLEEYNNELTTLSKDFHAVRNKIVNQTFTGSHATITRGLLHLCNVDKKDVPFPCDYNPYYGTGRLEHFNIDGCNYLVTPDARDNLYFINLSNPLEGHKLNTDQQIQRITGMSASSSNESNFLLLKHNTEISLLKFIDVDNIANVAFTKKFKRDIIDAKTDNTKVGVVLTDQIFRLYDKNTKQKIDLSDCSVNDAVRFEFIDDNTVATLTKKTLKILDLRSTDHRLLVPDMSNCEYLCSLKIDDKMLYLATRHYLIRTDPRFYKNFEYCSHLMKSSPCYIDLAGDFLCMSSQKSKEKVVFQGRPISSLPIHVPSIDDTLRKCRLTKDLLLRGDIEERLQKSVGGVKLISDDKETALYSVNSLGDIFKQKICNNVENDDIPIDSLYLWLNNLPRSRKPLHLTHVVNASEVKFSLNKKTEQKHLVKFTSKSGKADYFLSRYKNRYHKDNLGELAANFVAIWEEDEEEERENVVVPEVAPLDKVSDWIDSFF